MKEVASLQLLQGGRQSGGHPGVEELIEALADDTTLYKICSWYSGGELFDLAPLPENLAKPVFAQILDAVNFVHGQGGFCGCLHITNSSVWGSAAVVLQAVYCCSWYLVCGVRVG